MNNEENQVPEKPIEETSKPKKTKKKLKPVRLLSTLLIGVLLVVAFVFLINFINSTSQIISKEKSNNCNGENCMEIQTVYSDGWVFWKAAEFLPSFFSMTSGGFENGQKTLVTCPVKSNTNDFAAKLGFFFNNPDIQKCVVTAR